MSSSSIYVQFLCICSIYMHTHFMKAYFLTPKYGMTCSFNHLYGPPKSSGDNSINEWPDDDSSNTPVATVSSNTPVATVSSSSSSSSTSSTATKSSSEAACSAHPKCKSLGLTGDCCPHDGVMLGCCS